MADKKKMSVADILAAARKADGGDQEAAPAEDAPAAESAAAASESSESTATEKAAAAKKPAAKPGERPSVADILAAARSGGKSAAAATPAKKPAAKKPAGAKPAAKPAATKGAPSGPRDTASILAAARKEHRPGPISKEEAAKSKPAGAEAKKPAPSVKPMPAKPAYAKPAPKAAAKGKVDEERRGILGFWLGTAVGLGFASLAGATTAWTLGLARFMFPNVLAEPPSRFKVGFPDGFPPGAVETKFKAQYGVWVVNADYNGQPQLFALSTVCTHLGCTPNWLEGEQKFKCPCHGSGFYKSGINFEGPAPRPLERYAIRIADDGQVEIDKSRKFQEEMGDWSEPDSFVMT